MKAATCIVPEPLAEWLRSMPKIELHVHVEGATSPAVFWELGCRNSIALPAGSLAEWENFFNFRDFEHFIHVYANATACLKTANDYFYLTDRFLADQSRQNILWTEAFISLSLLPAIKRSDLLEALADAISDGTRKYGACMTLIGDISRHVPDSQNEVFAIATEGLRKGVFSGLGLGGIERGFPPQLFAGTFQRAIKAGLKTYAHAGETTGPETIRDTIRLLQPLRIGHGINILQDPRLVAELAATQLPLEVCPGSNYALGLVSKDRLHPIRQMVDAGLLCTLGSDDPAMFATTLADEYVTLAAQGFAATELWQLNCNGLTAAQITEDARSILQKQFDDFIAHNPAPATD